MQNFGGMPDGNNPAPLYDHVFITRMGVEGNWMVNPGIGPNLTEKTYEDLQAYALH